MTKKSMNIASACVVALSSFIFISGMPAEDAITKQDGYSIVNTTTLGKSIRGFRGTTPVKIYIKGKKIYKIEALKNQETPKFFDKAKQILAKYNGLTIDKAAKANVDGVSGATFSSKALKENIKVGLDYYKKNK